MSYYENPSNLYGKSSGFGYPELKLPKLRADLVVRRLQYGPDEVFYIIKDPVSREYFKYPPASWDLISLFDGTRTEEEITEDYNEQHPFEPVDEEFVESWKAELKEMGLLDVSSTEKNLMLMDRIRTQRKNLVEKKSKWTFEYMTIFSFDPDEFLNRIIPYLRFLYTKWFFVVSTIAILLMFTINVVRWDEFWRGTVDLYSFQKKNLWDVVVFFLLFTFSLGIHELGHALTLKNYGGECHEMGFLLFYGSPAFFVDAGDAYTFERRSDRIWFSLSGCYSELLVCSIGAYIWFFTLPGTPIHDLAFMIFLFAGISGLLMNMNPLIKLDGYFILEDLVGIEGLREESFAFLSRWIKANIFGLSVENPPEMTARKRRIFLIYGITSILYTTSLYLLIVFWIRNIYLETFGQFGYILFAATIFLLFRKMLWEILGFLKFFYLDKKEVLMRRKKAIITGAVLLSVLLLIPLTHVKISSDFTVEPSERAEIRNEATGFVESIYVHENDSVPRNKTIATIRNVDLAENVRRVDNRLGLLDREILMIASTGGGPEYQMKLRSKEQLLSEKKEAERLLASLELKSPISGTVITPRLGDRSGSYLEKGSLLCVVANLDRVKITLPVREYDIGDVEVGQEVLMKLVAFPAETFHGKVSRISPAIAARVEGLEGTFTTFHVEALIANADRRLVPGMQGNAKILAVRHSIAGRMLRELWRGIQSIVW